MKTDFVDVQLLEDYLDDKLDPIAMHQVERLSLEDPFVAEALEGLRNSPKRKQNLSLLQKQLHSRIAERPMVKKHWNIFSHRISIAATAALMFISASIVFWLKENQLRKNKGLVNREVKVQLTPLSSPTSKVEDQKSVDYPVLDLQKNEVVAINENKIKPSQDKISNNNISGQQVSARSMVASSPIAREDRNEPVGGMEAYKNYIISNNKLYSNSIGKKVSVQFTILENGSVKDFKIIQGIDKTTDAYAIKLISKGPRWIFNKNKPVEVYEVAF